MKVLVIGGMHGNEPLGLEVINLFLTSPVMDVDVVQANKIAIAQETRFVKNDLNRSFPGSLDSSDYETYRAAELVELCKQYDVVLDFHNTHCPDNDCVFIGETADFLLQQVAAYFSLSRVVVADYDCLNKYAPNCISIEISLSSGRMQPGQWYETISDLAKKKKLNRQPLCEFYRFTHRITLKERDELNLQERSIKAFQPIAPGLARKMGVPTPAYPIFIGDAYTPYNYGGLLNKIKL